MRFLFLLLLFPTFVAGQIQIRQEKNFINRAVTSTGNLDTEETKVLNTAKFTGTATYYFEVTAYSSNSASVIKLRRFGTTTDDATITINGGSTAVPYKVSFTPPAGSTTYMIRIESAGGATTGVELAKISIVHSFSGSSTTEAEFELGHYYATANNTSSSSWGKNWKYESAKWDGTVTFKAIVLHKNTTANVSNTFTSSGTFTAPTGVTSITVEAIGGGGAGGGGNQAGQGGGGGGGGAYSLGTLTVTPGNNYSYTIGAGGAGSTTSSNVGGGTTSMTGDAGGTVSAVGGVGGISGSGGGTNGSGGSAASGQGTTKFSGGAGAAGSSTVGGGGGGAAGSASNGNAASGQTGGGAILQFGSSTGGGGQGGASGGDGQLGSIYGGGGAGGGSRSGGSESASSGRDGGIRITYSQTPTLTIVLQEDDGSLGGWTTKATVYNSSATANTLSEVSFTPVDGRHYRFASLIDNSSATYQIYNAAIVVESNGTITKAQSQYTLINKDVSGAGDKVAGRIKFTPADWSGVSNTYTHYASGSGATIDHSLSSPSKSNSVSLNVSTNESGLRDVTVGDGGTKLFTVGSSNAVDVYTMSTAYDMSTATYSTTKDVSAQVNFGTSLRFKDDGTKLYILSYNTATIHQYALSTAWDITTATYESKSFTPGQAGSEVNFCFGNSGTKLYISSWDNGTVYQYSLGTAWDISTASSDGVSRVLNGSNPTIVNFSDDGTQYYQQGSVNTTYQYSLSTAWDMSSTNTLIGSWTQTSGLGQSYGGHVFQNRYYRANSTNLVHQEPMSSWTISSITTERTFGRINVAAIQGYSSTFTAPAVEETITPTTLNSGATIYSTALNVYIEKTAVALPRRLIYIQ